MQIYVETDIMIMSDNY